MVTDDPTACLKYVCPLLDASDLRGALELKVRLVLETIFTALKVMVQSVKVPVGCGVESVPARKLICPVVLL